MRVNREGVPAAANRNPNNNANPNPPGALLIPRLLVGRHRSAEQRTQPGELRWAEVCATGAAVTRAAVTGALAAADVAIPALAAAIAISAAAAAAAAGV